MNQSETITTLSFNQDASCIGVGSKDSCTIYKCDPFDEFFQMSGSQNEFQRSSNNENDGASLIEMLFSTSLIAVVGNKKRRFLKIINTKRKSTICVLSFPSNILNIKMNRKRLIVALLSQIFIYDIGCMKLLHTIETAPNPNGIISLSYGDDSVLAYPSNFTTNNDNGVRIDVANEIGDDEDADDLPKYKRKPSTSVSNNSNVNNSNNDDNGSIDDNSILKSKAKVKLPNNKDTQARNSRSRSGSRHVTNGSVIIYDALKLLPINAIVAHKTELAAISLNNDGDLIATASSKGTIIRVFNTRSNKKIGEFRRGMAGTSIHCISFNIDSTLLCCSSNNQTIHIFKLNWDDSNNSGLIYKGDLTDEETIEGNELVKTVSRNSSVSTSNNGSMNASQELMMNNYESSGDHSITTTITAEDHRRSSTDESLINHLLANKKRSSSASIASSLSGMIWNQSKNISKSLINNYLPQQISSILEPTRHFAFIRLSRNGSTESGSLNKDNDDDAEYAYGSERSNSNNNTSECEEESRKKDNNKYKSIVAFNRDSKYIMIGTNEGYFYIYNVPLQRGGECVLIKRYLLNDE